MARNARSSRRKKTEKELALGRARGRPWVPGKSPAKREKTSGRPPEENLVAEDEEGMIGHPEPR
jgi:hypothetical protein